MIHRYGAKAFFSRFFSGGCYFSRLRLIFSIRRTFIHTSARSFNTNNTSNREISSIRIKHINFRRLITHIPWNAYVRFFLRRLALFPSFSARPFRWNYPKNCNTTNETETDGMRERHRPRINWNQVHQFFLLSFSLSLKTVEDHNR